MTSRVADVVVVTGLSGAGKSTALRTLDDLGFYCVDNLPPSLVTQTVEVCAEGGVLPVALGLDVRVGTFLDQAEDAIETLAAQLDQLIVVFLEASDEVLVRRFSETRRPHPMLARPSLLDDDEPAPGRRAMAVLDGVQIERERLSGIRGLATVTIDTSHLSVHELRREIGARFGPELVAGARMLTRFVSFGFKYGLPLDADLVLDVRFLDNPHFVAELRPHTGQDDAVRRFVLSSPDCEALLRHLEALLAFALPRYEREGKSYLTVAIGCTGGRHRSVAIAEALAERVAVPLAFPVGVVHRDIARDGLLRQLGDAGRPPSAAPGGRSRSSVHADRRRRRSDGEGT